MSLLTLPPSTGSSPARQRIREAERRAQVRMRPAPVIVEAPPRPTLSSVPIREIVAIAGRRVAIDLGIITPIGDVRLIQERVAEAFGVTVEAIRGQRRTADVVTARFAAILLAQESAPLSLAQIARRFGGRDHSAILYAGRRARDMEASDPVFAAKIAGLRRQ